MLAGSASLQQPFFRLGFASILDVMRDSLKDILTPEGVASSLALSRLRDSILERYGEMGADGKRDMEGADRGAVYPDFRNIVLHVQQGGHDLRCLPDAVPIASTCQEGGYHAEERRKVGGIIDGVEQWYRAMDEISFVLGVVTMDAV